MEKDDSTRLLVVGTYTALYCMAAKLAAAEAIEAAHCSLSTPLLAWVSIFVIELS